METDKITNQTQAYRPSTSRPSQRGYADREAEKCIQETLGKIREAPQQVQTLTVPEAVRRAQQEAVSVRGGQDGGAALMTANATDFLQVYRPDNLTKMTATTPRAALELQRREYVGTIRQFYRQNRERTLAVLRLHLVNLNLCCDVRRPLNERQIEVVVDMIVNDWMLANLTLVDYMLVMRRAISGEYGEMFESLTPPKVLGWLKRYAEERAAEAAEMSREESEGYKSDPTRSRYHKEMAAKQAEERMHRVALERFVERINKRGK